MNAVSWSSIGFYCLFAFFAYFQKMHAKGFRGGSVAFQTALTISISLAGIIGVVFLIYYGWQVVWWAPIVFLIVSLVSIVVSPFVEMVVSGFYISLAGFIGWPVCAYFMFRLIPTAS